MMISQAMESRNPSHFAQTEDFPPKGTAVESFMGVRCGSDMSPYFNVESLHCEVLDIAEIVTIEECVSSEDSFSCTQGVISNTEIIPETERCGDCLSSSNLYVKTCLDEISCEASVVPSRNYEPCEESGGQKRLPVTVKDSCYYAPINAAESLSKATSSSDINNLLFLATNEVFKDAESCSDNCGACHELTSSDISEKNDFPRTNYFPLEVAHVMEITTSVGEEDDVSFQCLRGTSETVQAHGASQSLLFAAKSDSVMVPDPRFYSYEVDMTVSTDNQVSPCHSRSLSFFTNQESVASVANDPLIRPTSVLESDEAEMKNNEENKLTVCLEGPANVFSVDSMLNIMIVEDAVVQPLSETSVLDSHKKEIKFKEESVDNKLYAITAEDAMAQPLSVTESCEVKMKLKDNNGGYSCMTIVTDKALVQSPLVSELHEIEMKPGQKSEVFMCVADIANICDAGKLTASMPEDVGVQPLSVLESCGLKIETEEEVDICSGVKNEIGVGFMLNAATVNDSLVWHRSVLKSCEMEIKSKEKNDTCLTGIKKFFEAESDLNSIIAKDAEVQPLVVSESHEVSVISNDDCKMYSCRGIINEIDPVIGNAPVWPQFLESHETEMKLEEKNKVALQLMGSINIINTDNNLSAVTLEKAKLKPLSVLESCELKKEPEKETDGHLGVENECVFNFTSNATLVGSASVWPPLVLESPEKEISSEKLKNFTFHPTGITGDFHTGSKLKEKMTEDMVVQPSLVLDICEKEVKLKDDANVFVVFGNDSLVLPPPVLKSHESEVKLEDRNKVAIHRADVTKIFSADNIVADDADKMPSSVLDSCNKTESIQKMLSGVFAPPTNIGNNIDAEHMLNASVVENSIVMPSPVVKLSRLKIKSKENSEITLCNQGIMDSFNTNNKFLCSVMKKVGSDEVPDIELTKHLIKGLSFFTPVRDIIKSHRLFGPSAVNSPEISESSVFSGFRDVVYLGNAKQCCESTAAGMREVDLVEECCGHFSVSSVHTSCRSVSADISLKKCTQFGSITIYYFQRAQGFTTVSSDGGVALGMEFQHCDVELHSLLDYTFEKDQMHHKSSHRKRKKKRISISSSVNCENNKTVQILPSHKRTSLLRAAGIRNIDHSAIQEAAMINASRLACGCLCTDGCLPGVCFCARMEIECLIEREGFPCKCTEDNCYNPHGRTKFSPSKVHSHFVCTLMRLEKGEVLCEEPATSPDSLECDRSLVLTHKTIEGPQFDSSTPSISTLGCGLTVEPCVHVETLQTSFMELAHKV